LQAQVSPAIGHNSSSTLLKAAPQGARRTEVAWPVSEDP